ncbi:MAG TPA: aminotransferase class III-fold pyridoxal phosphate-dependent enzyme, partial [Pirellulaceae bacterium]|nr:aminotransferase class III-fold pyridoxal phosphate-dependent enzyme [Pirellulaceae bacterium]
LRAIHEIATQQGLLVIHDEIATGFGRTGRMFASEWAEVTPDIACLGKGLTGGLMSLAAAVASSEVYAAFFRDAPEAALMHGPTYMGNPLACSAALASLEIFSREPRLEQVARIERLGTELLADVRRLPGVVDVRARGAFLAVELDHWVNGAAVMAAAPDWGVWLRPLRNVLYLAPPFVIQDDELQVLTTAVINLIRRGV